MIKHKIPHVCREVLHKCLARLGQRQLACCLLHWRSYASEHARLKSAQQQVATIYRKAALTQIIMRWHQLWREKSLLRTCLQQLHQGAAARALRQWQVSYMNSLPILVYDLACDDYPEHSHINECDEPAQDSDHGAAWLVASWPQEG